MELFKTVIGHANSIKSPIVVFHGIFGSSRNWQTISQSLFARLSRQIICVDMRNHGRSVEFCDSKPVASPMTWELLAIDTERIIKELKRPIVLLGHSWGGQVIMQSLFRYAHLRDNIECAIIVDMSPTSFGSRTLNLNTYLDAMIRINELSWDRNKSMAEFRKTEPNEMIVQFLFTNFGTLPNGKSGFLLPLCGLRQALASLAETQIFPSTPIETDALFIKGAKSDYLNPKDILTIQKCFKNYRIAEVPNSGHWVHHENPDAFRDLVSDFLS